MTTSFLYVIHADMTITSATN